MGQRREEPQRHLLGTVDERECTGMELQQLHPQIAQIAPIS
jgi:hypothetical protein